MERVKTYLDDIVASHRTLAAADPRDVGELRARAMDGPTPPSLADALSLRATFGVIAELKRRSPSKGAFADVVDLEQRVKTYEAAGAAAISVLTDGPHFGGSLDDLREVVSATSIPRLRKDFTVCEADVYDAKLAGASAVLLIVAVLSDDELAQFASAAESVGLDVLFEAHDEAEVARALAVGATMIGINQRDLVTFEVDRARALRTVSAIPDDVLRVAESGITGLDDARHLAEAGYDACLIGEYFMRADDPYARVHEIASLPRDSARMSR
jgi:indole-3-glycerol phosphate synthase